MAIISFEFFEMKDKVSTEWKSRWLINTYRLLNPQTFFSCIIQSNCHIGSNWCILCQFKWELSFMCCMLPRIQYITLELICNCVEEQEMLLYCCCELAYFFYNIWAGFCVLKGCVGQGVDMHI